MNDVKIKPVILRLDGNEFEIICNLNVLAELEGRYGNIENVMDEVRKLKELRWIVMIMINESLENDENAVTEKWVGAHITMSNITQIANRIVEAFKNSFPEVDEGEAIANPHVAKSRKKRR